MVFSLETWQNDKCSKHQLKVPRFRKKA